VDAIKLTPDKIQLEEELFTASVRTFLAQIVSLDNTLNTVMCVGHNPTLSYLAEYITKAEIGNLPPAGLVIIQFNTKYWKDVGEGTGELVRLLTPELF
jgi:phosphohistidine phosphatase